MVMFTEKEVEAVRAALSRVQDKEEVRLLQSVLGKMEKVNTEEDGNGMALLLKELFEGIDEPTD